MTQNDFNNVTTDVPEFWEHALLPEFQSTWGNVKKFERELGGLCAARAATCWIEKTSADRAARRALLAGYAYDVLSPETIKKYRRMLPCESVADKYLDNLCTVYNSPPQRVFWPVEAGPDGAAGDDKINRAFDELYAEADVDARLRDAYRYAVMTNVVLVRPVVDADGEYKVRVLTPDLFRVVTDEDDPTRIAELWIVHALNPTPDGQETVFRVWTAEQKDPKTGTMTPASVRLCDYQGDEVPDSVEASKYGRIPYVVLRLHEQTDRDFYGAGESDLVELCVWRNLMRLFSTRNALFQSFAIAVATNLGLTVTDEITGRTTTIPLGPDMVIEADHTDPEIAPPSLVHEAPTPTFEMLEDYARNVVREKLRNLGLPGFSVDEGAGTPPTGAALEVLERELVDKRMGHAKALRRFERAFAELFATVARVDGGREEAFFPTQLKAFSTTYTTSRRYMEISAELDHDLKLVEGGFMYPSTFVAKWVGVDGGLTDEKAIELRDKLKALWSGAAASSDVSGTVGALVAVTQMQKDVKAGLMTRGHAVETAIQFLKRTPEQAAQLFKEDEVIGAGDLTSGAPTGGATDTATADGAGAIEAA